MTKKNPVLIPFTEQEQQIIEQMRRHPEMMARFESILAITSNAAVPLKTADEVEELLIAELRRLGNVSMCQWAAHAEARVGAELQQQDPPVLRRKKKR